MSDHVWDGTYQCNGNKSHIAIIYGSEPCPLCASHRCIADLLAALREVAEWATETGAMDSTDDAGLAVTIDRALAKARGTDE